MRLNSPSGQIIVQLLLAVAYVAFMRQLLALGVMLWGEGASGFELVSRMLLAVFVGLIVIYSLNYVVVRALYCRLGLFIGVAIFGYYYVFNPFGHNHILVYLGILRSPSHLFNMLLLVLAPAAIGKFIDARVSIKNANVAA